MTDDQFADGILGQMRAAPVISLDASSRVVVMSDMHLGDGSANDDMRDNGELVTTALERYYLPRGSTLILNGDIEDLQKFPYGRIRSAWKSLFSLFDHFAREGRLYKVYGNHDADLLEWSRYPYPLHAGVRLERGGRSLYVYHGHQASGFFVKHNDLSGAVIRYVLHTLRIHNRNTRMDSNRRYGVERKIYEFSRRSGIVSVIGHTHRPLFESLSKYDRLRYAIEALCAEYSKADEPRKAAIAETVALYKDEFRNLGRKDRKNKRAPGLYGRDLLLPCLFNSGSAVGNHGATALEFESGRIALVYWFEEGKERAYLEREAGPSSLLEGTRFRRVVIASQSLDDIFARMDLLA
jgi:predicted phosphodiesterase